MIWLKKFAGDEGGNFAIIAALGFPSIAGGLAFGAEASLWMMQKTSLSHATDAAAVTAANLFTRKTTTPVIDADNCPFWS